MKGFQDDRVELLDELKLKGVRLLLSMMEGSFEADIVYNIT